MREERSDGEKVHLGRGGGANIGAVDNRWTRGPPAGVFDTGRNLHGDEGRARGGKGRRRGAGGNAMALRTVRCSAGRLTLQQLRGLETTVRFGAKGSAGRLS